jgi:peptidyl-prolyl cis-trans isomerase B (cyclophilin B)
VASTSQRRRQLARLRWEKQQARRAAAAARARRRRRVLAIVMVVALVVASVAAAVVWWPWAGDDATTAQETPAPTSAADGTCAYTEAGTEEPIAGLPPATPTAATTATLTVGGKPVSVELLPDAAPCTVSSFAHLAANDYFDATTCHRLTTSDTLKVLQCGDPTGSGSGGPGYQFGVENTEGATYPAGTVAMARGDDPGSNGSQFFIVYGDSQLPPDPGYTVFGRVTEGLDLISKIAAVGTADGSADGPPKKPVTLDEVVTAE